MAHWFNSKHWSSWHPSSWHGWIITTIYVVLVLAVFLKVELGTASISEIIIRMLLPFFLLSLIFVIICKKTSK